ncbi:Flavo-diiron protein FprA2 [uncultured Eubacteriales bacterium]|uniref:Flavo-diiron protein FprA2 n=1 Tax=uncultured Eubacteriales bacterium TaxID=172733 RepID=A0A212K8M5_9FIRM|nr:Flavo-diiron protein FprA2 [uncultured Eubacteriales bacterium]
MGTIKLKDNLYSVGVLNPGLRVFDIVMHSPYGTSYNSYLLTGEKNALVETVHVDFWEEYRANIESVIPLEKLDYLIMDHNEPDHSGSVVKLLELCPNLTILCSQSGKRYLEEITNRSFNCRVVKQGDTLDLGGRTLEFIPAPMLHWADSMFTWSPSDKVLFSCDFLGTHYCEPTMMDITTHYPEAYMGQVKNYFDCIFGPFKPFVLAGLDKIGALSPAPELICTCHGPCLTESIGKLKTLYREWSAPVVRQRKLAAVLYCSAYGCTAALARAAAKALEDEGLDVEIRDVTFTDLAESAALANECDLLAVGSPTINRDAPKAIWDVLASIDAINVKGKPAFTFGSYGWSGEASEMLRIRLQQLKFCVPDAPLRAMFTPTEANLAAVAELACESATKLC